MCMDIPVASVHTVLPPECVLSHACLWRSPLCAPDQTGRIESYSYIYCQRQNILSNLHSPGERHCQSLVVVGRALSAVKCCVNAGAVTGKLRPLLFLMFFKLHQLYVTSKVVLSETGLFNEDNGCTVSKNPLEALLFPLSTVLQSRQSEHCCRASMLSFV